MADLSNALENEIINRYLRNTTSITPSATVYLHLHTGDPGEDGNSNYSTAYTTGVAIAFNAPTDGVATNNGAVLFSTAAAGETLTHASIRDSATQSGGNCLFSDAGGFTARVVVSGDDVQVNDTELSVTMA